MFSFMQIGTYVNKVSVAATLLKKDISQVLACFFSLLSQ